MNVIKISINIMNIPETITFMLTITFKLSQSKYNY